MCRVVVAVPAGWTWQSTKGTLLPRVARLGHQSALPILLAFGNVGQVRLWQAHKLSVCAPGPPRAVSVRQCLQGSGWSTGKGSCTAAADMKSTQKHGKSRQGCARTGKRSHHDAIAWLERAARVSLRHRTRHVTTRHLASSVWGAEWHLGDVVAGWKDACWVWATGVDTLAGWHPQGMEAALALGRATKSLGKPPCRICVGSAGKCVLAPFGLMQKLHRPPIRLSDPNQGRQKRLRCISQAVCSQLACLVVYGIDACGSHLDQHLPGGAPRDGLVLHQPQHLTRGHGSVPDGFMGEEKGIRASGKAGSRPDSKLA